LEAGNLSRAEVRDQQSAVKSGIQRGKRVKAVKEAPHSNWIRSSYIQDRRIVGLFFRSSFFIQALGLLQLPRLFCAVQLRRGRSAINAPASSSDPADEHRLSQAVMTKRRPEFAQICKDSFDQSRWCRCHPTP
jgi:hypothetical protein